MIRLVLQRSMINFPSPIFRFMWFMIKVTFGEHDRCTEKGAETRYVVRVLTGDFSFLNFDNDIALLRLNERVPLSDTIRPICLPSVRGDYFTISIIVCANVKHVHSVQNLLCVCYSVIFVLIYSLDIFERFQRENKQKRSLFINIYK